MMTSKWIGILGYPLGHSLSKQIHTEKLQKFHLPYIFRVLEWGPKEISPHLQELKQDSTCLGFSVTMPYKEKIISYLDHCEDFAKKVLSVNCVKNVGGQWWGYNTDAPGFIKHFKCWNPLPPKDVRVVVIGAGATARTLSYALALEGYKQFMFINRTLEKSQAWAKKIKTLVPEIQAKTGKWGTMPYDQNIFVINTTPVRVSNEGLDWIDRWGMEHPAWIFDVTYNPPETPLIRECRQHCFYTMNGWPMFQTQADLAFKIWTTSSS